MSSKICIVIASINELWNMSDISDEISNQDAKIIVVDEGVESIRSRNKDLLKNLNVEFYGPKERLEWFMERFNEAADSYASVIPERCHAETSFGFLVAWEEKIPTVIEIDDDVKFLGGQLLIEHHLDNLNNYNGVSVYSDSKWYNTLENIKLNDDTIFPRGHPYDLAARAQKYFWVNESSNCVLNMGLWSGYPDLDALTILYNGGLNGRCDILSKGIVKEKIIVGKGTYFAICSMNTSFHRKIIPAFYQPYMKYIGIDRFDDIWSGIFLKKIADHLGDKVCLGKPLVYHDKRSRNTFEDLKSELEGMAINEVLWKVVDGVELYGKDYSECYSEIANGIGSNLDKFNEKLHRDFMKLQIEKMRLWLSTLERIGS